MKLKTNIFILLALLISFTAFSQSDAQKRETEDLKRYIKMVQNAPYVFEGEVIHFEDYYNAKQQPARQYYIRITKILRGDAQIRYGTIEVVSCVRSSYIGYDEGTRETWDNRSGRQEKQYAIVFCEPNKNSTPLSPNISTDNQMRLQFFNNTPDSYISLTNRIIHTSFFVFQSEKEMYKNMKKYAPDLRLIPEEYDYKKNSDNGPIHLDTTGYYQKKAKYDKYYRYLKKYFEAKKSKAKQ